MKIALLDVNVLIALLDPGHESHDAAHHWFEKNAQHGWATCPITENGCVRILSKLYTSLSLTVPQLARALRHLCGLEGHHFWPDSASILDAEQFDLAQIRPKAITDIYLLGLACANGGRLATFDRSIPWQSVTRARREDLEVIH